MIRWGFVGFTVLAVAVLMRFTPVAYADGCEGGDSSGGQHAVAFGCDNGIGNEGHNNGKGNGACKSEWVVSDHTKYAVK
jgi:hypothetical protein